VPCLYKCPTWKIGVCREVCTSKTALSSWPPTVRLSEPLPLLYHGFMISATEKKLTSFSSIVWSQILNWSNIITTNNRPQTTRNFNPESFFREDLGKLLKHQVISYWRCYNSYCYVRKRPHQFCVALYCPLASRCTQVWQYLHISKFAAKTLKRRNFSFHSRSSPLSVHGDTSAWGKLNTVGQVSATQ